MDSMGRPLTVADLENAWEAIRKARFPTPRWFMTPAQKLGLECLRFLQHCGVPWHRFYSETSDYARWRVTVHGRRKISGWDAFVRETVESLGIAGLTVTVDNPCDSGWAWQTHEAVDWIHQQPSHLRSRWRYWTRDRWRKDWEG